jgi:hypothetical protein
MISSQKLWPLDHEAGQSFEITVDKTIAGPIDAYGNRVSLWSFTPKQTSFIFNVPSCDSVFYFVYVYTKSDVETREYFCII